MATDKDKITNVLDLLESIFDTTMYSLIDNDIVCSDKTYVCNRRGEIIRVVEA